MKVSNLEIILDQVMAGVDEASVKILDIYNDEDISIEKKGDGSPVTLADKTSHEILFSTLSSIDKSIPVLSEEGEIKDSNVDLFWLVDPLDGTKEFIHKNGEFTVNVALIERGRPILGVVSAPALEEKFIGLKGEAYRISQGVKTKIHSRSQSKDFCLVTVSKSHKSEKDELFIKLCEERFKEVKELPTGSSLKLCRVAEGRADVYCRLGPTYQWDIAAGQAVVEAAGGNVSDLNGRSLKYEFVSETKNPLFYCTGDGSYPWKEVFCNLI